MRRILLMIIILLVAGLGVLVVVEGIEIGNLKVSSVSKIGEDNENLDASINDLNDLINLQYPTKMEELKKASQNMQDAKEEYLYETNKSTNTQILEAMQQKSYRIEFLWVRLETHAKEQRVVLKFEILPSSIGASTANDIKFTVNGTYNDTIRFISALENDTDLNFKIENFKMQPTDSSKMSELAGLRISSNSSLGDLRYIFLESTFNVRNIGIEEDTLSKTIMNAESSKEIEDNTKSNNKENDEQKTTDKSDEKIEETIEKEQNNTEEQKSAKQIMEEF